jgi:Leucine-rich repeat (LRR) protein
MPIPAETLERIKKNDPTLTTLDLSFQEIDDDDIELLCDAMANNTKLTTLDLLYNSIGPDGAKALARNTTLTSLDVSGNGIGPDGAEALANNTTLTTLNLTDNAIRLIGAKALANNTSLTTLKVAFNGIGDVGAEALAKNTSLTTLDVSYNSIGPNGAKALAGNKTLLKLNCESYSLSIYQLKTLETTIAKNRVPRSLNNVKTANNPEQLDAIIRELKALNTHLDLYDNQQAQNLQQALAFCEILKPLKDIGLLNLRKHRAWLVNLTEARTSPEKPGVAELRKTLANDYTKIANTAFKQLDVIANNPDHFACEYAKNAAQELQLDLNTAFQVSQNDNIHTLSYENVLVDIVSTKHPLLRGMEARNNKPFEPTANGSNAMTQAESGPSTSRP